MQQLLENVDQEITKAYRKGPGPTQSRCQENMRQELDNSGSWVWSGHSEPSSEPPPTEPRRREKATGTSRGDVFLSICEPQPPLEPPLAPKRRPAMSQPKEVKWTATNKKHLQALSQTRPDWPPRLVLRCGVWSPCWKTRGADCRAGRTSIPITTREALSRCTLVVCPSSLLELSPGGVSVFQPWLPLTRCRPAIGLGTCRHPVSAAIVVALDCSCQD
jgi:hypothetical protein